MVKFSVVIPTYNRADCITRCIDSVLNQTYQDFEIVVVDNYSEDSTTEIVQGYKDSRIHIFQIHNNGIIAASRNKGICESKGEWVCLLDSDDWFYPQKLSNVIQYVNQYDIIYHDLDIYNNRGKVWNKRVKGRCLYRNIINDLLTNNNGIPNSSVSIRASVIKSVRGFSTDERLIAVEDSDCWIRVAELTQRFKYISQSLGGYWIGSNMSCSIKQIKREQALVDGHIDRLTFSERKEAYKSLYYRQARVYHKLGLYKQARNEYWKSFSLKHIRAMVLYVVALFRILI